MPVVGRYGLVRREQWQGIETEGKGHSTAAEVVVECGGMIEDLMAQKRYGVEVEIEGQLVAEIEGPSELVQLQTSHHSHQLLTFQQPRPYGWTGREICTIYKPSVPSTTDTRHRLSLEATLAWRDIARRALTIRLLGYIMVPALFIMPGVILDILDRTGLAPVPNVAVTITTTTPGLMGTSNALLFRMDPTVLAIIYSLRAREQSPKDSKHCQRHNARELDGSGDGIQPSRLVMTTTAPSQQVVFPTVRVDTTDDSNGMEYEGHFTVRNTSLPSISSTFGYDANELADAYDSL